jgi:hypothetical protein
MVFTDRVGGGGGGIGNNGMYRRAGTEGLVQNNIIGKIEGGVVDNKSKSKTLIENPGCWVKKWVDYSSKYGLGYLLSN